MFGRKNKLEEYQGELQNERFWRLEEKKKFEEKYNGVLNALVGTQSKKEKQ